MEVIETCDVLPDPDQPSLVKEHRQVYKATREYGKLDR